MQRKYISLGLVLASLLIVTFVAGEAIACSKGDRVLGQWRDGRWYPARVAEVVGTKCKVNFDDGDVSVLPPSKLKKVHWTVGTRVQCNWKNRGKYYNGKITSKNGDAIHISYDDGDQEDATISRCRSL